MKTRKVCNILILAMGLLALADLFLPYLSLGSGSGMTGALLNEAVKGLLGTGLGNVQISAVELVVLVGTAGSELGGGGIVFLILFLLLFPFILLLLSACLAFIKAKVKYVVIVVAAALSGILLIMEPLVFIPKFFSSMISGFGGGFGSSFAGNLMGGIALDLLGAGFWIAVVLSFAIMVTALVGYCAKVKPGTGTVRKASPAPRQAEQPVPVKRSVIHGLAGMYKDGDIEIHSGDVITLGRDAQNCNLVLEGKKVSRSHCAILFDPTSDMYAVKDTSTNGTYINNVRLKSGEFIPVKRGSILTLGSDENIFRLD